MINLETLLREGYEEMAEHDLALHEEFAVVDSNTPWPEYVETNYPDAWIAFG